MGFVFLDRYDVEACAQQCNARDADPNGGACQYFNIWRALVDGVPTTYTCSMVGHINPSLRLKQIHFFSTSSPQTYHLLLTPDKETYKLPIPEVMYAKTMSSTVVSKVTSAAVISALPNHTITGSEQVLQAAFLMPLSFISNLTLILVTDLVFSVLEQDSIRYRVHLRLLSLFKPSLVDDM
jgi:hypothetical protein